MRRALYLCAGMGIGALVMFLADPDQGRRRRSLIRDKSIGLWNRMGRTVSGLSHDVANRSRGLYYEAVSILDVHPVSDDVLRERVRSEIGHAVSDSKSIHVKAHDGCIILSGSIQADDVDSLFTCVSSVRGVKALENRLKVFQSLPESPEGR